MTTVLRRATTRSACRTVAALVRSRRPPRAWRTGLDTRDDPGACLAESYAACTNIAGRGVSLAGEAPCLAVGSCFKSSRGIRLASGGWRAFCTAGSDDTGEDNDGSGSDAMDGFGSEEGSKGKAPRRRRKKPPKSAEEGAGPEGQSAATKATEAPVKASSAQEGVANDGEAAAEGQSAKPKRRRRRKVPSDSRSGTDHLQGTAALGASISAPEADGAASDSNDKDTATKAGGKSVRRQGRGGWRRKAKQPFGSPLPEAVPGGRLLEDMLPTEMEMAVDCRSGREASEDEALSRELMPHAEVVHALSRGLPEQSLRDIAEHLRKYLKQGPQSERILEALEQRLARRPHQAEWAMPLIREHAECQEKPHAKTHAEHLEHVREANKTARGPLDVAEIMLHVHAGNEFYQKMTREELKQACPERWIEATELAEQVADRLPHEKYIRFLKTLEAALMGRVPNLPLRKLKAELRNHAPLVVPAMAKFWRVEPAKNLADTNEEDWEDFIHDQRILANLLTLARRTTIYREHQDERDRESLDADSTLSIEELNEKQAARSRVRTDANERGKGEGQESQADARRRLRRAAINLISLAEPPQETSQPKLPSQPIGMFDLYVIENPRELNLPPPADIFGGDTPMGIGTAGMSEVPVWNGRDEEATLGITVEDQYRWPEEVEEEERNKERDGDGGGVVITSTRATDYQKVEDFLLTGKRRERPPRVTVDDLEEDMRVQAHKIRLLQRSALVAELHPDEIRQMEIIIEEQGKRTVFLRDLPMGLSTEELAQAFSRCGEVEDVIIKEPTFRAAKPEKTRRRFVVESPHSAFVSSSPHALVVFKDMAGFEKATAQDFRVFGVNVRGVNVPTRPAAACRTVYVENTIMKRGKEFVDAINEVILPEFEVMLKSHSLDDDMPQAVSIPLRTYAQARTIDAALRGRGFFTAFHYLVPKANAPAGDSIDILRAKSAQDLADSREELISRDEYPRMSMYDRVVALAQAKDEERHSGSG